MAESDSLNGFNDLVGLQADALSQTLGVDPESVGIEVCDPVVGEETFEVRAIYIGGLSYTLWKSATLEPESWARVDNAVIEQVGEEIVLADPDSKSGKRFYQLRREIDATSNSPN